MRTRCSFTINFSANLDMIPGWGYTEHDWIVNATRGFLNSAGYDPKVEVLACSDARGAMGGWTDLTSGWREDVEALRTMDPMTKFQYRTKTGTYYDWVELWAFDLNHVLRQPGKSDALIAFRLENEVSQPPEMAILGRILPHLVTIQEFRRLTDPTEEQVKEYRHAIEELSDDSDLFHRRMEKLYEEMMDQKEAEEEESVE